jgi:hypothetical protein
MGLGISDFAGIIKPSDKSFSTGLQRGRQIGIQNQVSKEVQNVVNTPVPQGSSLEEEIGMAYARLGFPDQAVSFREKGLQRRTGQQNIESTQQEIDKKKMENLSSQLDLVKKHGTNETFMNFINETKSTFDPESDQFKFFNAIKSVDLTNNVAKLEKVLDESDFADNDQLSSLGLKPGMNVIVTTDLDTGELKGVESKKSTVNTFKYEPGVGIIDTTTGEPKINVKELGVPAQTIKEKSEQEQSLRKEYSGLTSNYRKIRDSYSTIIASVEDPSAAGDLSLIFSYMKLLDPTSVVREGEQASAQNATGTPNQIRNLYNKVIDGTRLNEEQRSDFLDRAEKLFSIASNNNIVTENAFKKLAKSQNLDPENVVIDFSQPEPKKDNTVAKKDDIFTGKDGKEYRVIYDDNGKPVGKEEI